LGCGPHGWRTQHSYNRKPQDTHSCQNRPPGSFQLGTGFDLFAEALGRVVDFVASVHWSCDFAGRRQVVDVDKDGPKVEKIMRTPFRSPFISRSAGDHLDNRPTSRTGTPKISPRNHPKRTRNANN
jgi:hypothetical protein